MNGSLDLGPARIVAIDDKEVNLRLMRACLQAEPYELATFTDARLALEAIAQAPPDLVLLDLMMPEMDGFAALERLREIAPQVPVVVISGIEDRDARLRGLAAGARDFLGKPVDRSELVIRVRNLVALKQSGDALARALAQLEAANRDLEAFAGGLAHDLQQPITTVAAFAQVIERGQLIAPAGLAHLRRITGAAESARNMIRGLLEFARLGQRKIVMEPVALDAVVAEARNALSAQLQGKPVAWHLASPLPVVRGDPALLLLAVVNLLSNGIKYSRKREQPEIWIEGGPEDAGGHTLRVRDNGVGFDMAHTDRLFSPFERLHSANEFEGTGMGLANVRRIMERHGGAVYAESEPDQGATFTLLFRA